ncbi:hypothetical protein FQA39_LY04919 [Lamprigera yunnana]|nr:hypothetical protein FQA39_LY04919 [Lamprigera yunnana]
MEPYDGIKASTFYGRRYKDLESAIGDLEDDDRQIDLTIIPPSPDYETDLDDIDEHNIQSDVFPANVPGKIEVFTNDSEYDSDDNIPVASPPRVSEPAPPDLLSPSSDSHVVDLELLTNNLENENENVIVAPEQSPDKTFVRAQTCTVAFNNQYVENKVSDKRQINEKQSKRPFSYPCGLIYDNSETENINARKRYSDPPKIVNVTNSRGKAQVKPFTKESLERLERRTVQLVREYGFQPKRKLSVEDGSRLPQKYEPFPSSLYGRPLEEIDNFIYDEVL